VFARRDSSGDPSARGAGGEGDADTSPRTEQDRRALEAIERQLDIDYGPPPGWDQAHGARDGDEPATRAHRVWRIALFTGRALVWVTAAALVTILYIGHAGPPGTSEPPAPALRRPEPAAPAPPRLVPPPVASPPTARPLIEAALVPTAPQREGVGGRAYWIQVGAFRNPDSARRLAARLREQDAALAGRVVVLYGAPGGSSLARVRLGPFATREEAAAGTRTLRELGYEPAIAEERG